VYPNACEQKFKTIRLPRAVHPLRVSNLQRTIRTFLNFLSFLNFLIKRDYLQKKSEHGMRKLTFDQADNRGLPDNEVPDGIKQLREKHILPLE
jgi:hypothetical protein